MKKLLFVLVMFCAVSFFTSCTPESQNETNSEYSGNGRGIPPDNFPDGNG